MNAYSADLRKRVIEAIEGGMPRAVAVETFRVSLDTIKRYLKLKQEGRELAPKPSPGRTPKITCEQHPQLEEQLRTRDTAILQEHAELWEERQGVRLSITAMARAIKRLGWTRKKGVWVRASVTSGGERSGGGR